MPPPGPPGPFLRLVGLPVAGRDETDTRALERKDAAWLALLALDGASPRDRIAAWLWPEVPAKTAAGSLRQRIFRLRKRLGHELVRAADTVALLPGVQLLTDGGELLAGLDYADCPEFAAWLERQRGQRQARRIDALAERAARQEAAGELAAAIETALELLAEQPLSEHAARRLMRLHYLRGDRAAAIAVFEHFEGRLKNELGTRPGRETLDLLAIVEAAAPLAARAPPGRCVVPASLMRPPRFVGRQRELELLHAAWAAGRVFLVLGEAGMGKSRLLAELAATRDAALAVSARPGDTGVPFALLARLLRALREQREIADDAATRRELARVLPELGGGTVLAGEGQRLLLQRAVEGVLEAAAPAELLLDDLHFADSASLEMLQALVTGERLAGLRWGLAQRSGEDSAAALALAAALTETQRLQPVRLAPFTAPQIAELIESLGLPELDAGALAGPLLRHTGGNPLFLLETLKDRLLQAGSGSALPLPATVGTLIERRLRTLGPQALALARVAAIAGTDFGIALAEAVLETPALALADAWAELEAAQVLAGGGFAHDLMHDAVLRSVPGEIARHVHGAVAAWLDRRGAPAAARADHWAAAGRHAEAGRAWRDAAHAALLQGRREDEGCFLDRAAGHFEQAGLRDEAFAARLARLDGIGSVQGVAAGLERAEALLAQAADAAQRAQVQARRAQVLLWAGRTDEVLLATQQVLDLGPPAGEAALVESVVHRARALAALGRAAEAAALMDAWAARAERADEASLALGFAGSYAAVLMYANRRRDALAAADRHLELARAAARADEEREALIERSTVLCALGRVEAAVASAGEARLLAQSLNVDGPARHVHETSLAWFLQGAGRYAQALALFETGLAGLRRQAAGSPYVANAECFLADTYLALGQPARALRLMAEAYPSLPGFVVARRAWTGWLAERRNGHPPRERLEAALAHCTGDAGLPMSMVIRLDLAPELDATLAIDLCRAVLRDAERTEALLVALKARLRLMDALRRAGDLPAAAAEATAAGEWLRERRGPGVFPPEGYLACALALRAAGRPGAAEAWLIEGRRWIEEVALPHVPAEFHDSFLRRQPANAALLAALAPARR
jgi:DNA-binding SARP family transcriptional activator/tetratricopeptide (TPR) repeat protein